MKTTKQLQEELRNEIGSDEYPLVNVVKINSISVKQMMAMLNDRHIPIEYPVSRQTLEDLMKAAVDGSDEVVLIDVVNIDSMTDYQCREALLNVSRPKQAKRKLDESLGYFHEIGSDENPVSSEVQIASLTGKQLITMLRERNIPIQYPVSRQTLEDLMKAAMDGNDKVVLNDREAALLTISRPRKTIRKLQQELAENCGYSDEIIWDFLHKKDYNVLRNKINQLIPDQGKSQKAIEEIRNDICNSIWDQRKYTNGNSLSSIFYVMVTNESDFNIAIESTQFSCHPVFRCRKCVAEHDSSRCCMVYVDETGRVYQNWKSFVEENVLPAGTMVSPHRGVYNFGRKGDVILDVYCTPNGSAGAQLMNIAQTDLAVLGVGAACVPVAALALPVAAPLMAVSGLVCLGVSAFSAVTSAVNLNDRLKHEQSISLRNSQARSSYMGIAGGVAGMAAVGTTKLMTSMAAAGKATAGIEILVNGINISTIILSGSGVANGVLDLIFRYKDDDTISALDVLQLSASLVLFTHSIYNFQLASQVANEARTSSIKSYRESLSNRQRQMFDKMSKETVRIHGDTQGKMDIIRNINKIPDRQYLNDLFKINKELNKVKVRPAFGSSGDGVVLNNEMAVDTGVLRQIVQHTKGPNILEQVASPIPPTHNSGDAPTTEAPRAVRMLFTTDNGALMDESIHLHNTFNNNRLYEILTNLVIRLESGDFIYLIQYGEKFLRNIADGQKFQDVILSMAENFEKKTLKYILKLSQNFIDNTLDTILHVIGIYIPTEHVIYRIIKHVLKNYRDLSCEYIASKQKEIVEKTKKYYLSLNANNAGNKSTKCRHCAGRYSICNL